MAEHVLAVLVDFENMARPGAKSRGDFDIDLVLSRLAEKGRVVVKRAYADWSRYREAKIDLQNAGLELIEMPSAREGAKNRADIKLAVDAMELAYSREHVDNFVIVSGDSDFTPLVMRLKELNKRVIGCGTRGSTSRLIAETCDEFFFYDTLRNESRLEPMRPPKQMPAAAAASSSFSSIPAPVPETDEEEGLTLDEAFELLVETLENHQRDEPAPVHASVLKASMKRKEPTFSEVDLGMRTFARFLETAAQKGLVTLSRDDRAGGVRVDLPQSAHDEAPQARPTSVRTLGPEARRLQGLLAEAGLEIGEPRERRIVVEQFVATCAERARRNRSCAIQFVLGDILRRTKQEAPDIAPRTVKAVTHALLRAGLLIHPNGEAARATTAPFIAPESAAQLLDELHAAGLRALVARGENPDDTVLTELFMGTEGDGSAEREPVVAEAAPKRAVEAPRRAPEAPTNGDARNGEARTSEPRAAEAPREARNGRRDEPREDRGPRREEPRGDRGGRKRERGGRPDEAPVELGWPEVHPAALALVASGASEPMNEPEAPTEAVVAPEEPSTELPPIAPEAPRARRTRAPKKAAPVVEAAPEASAEAAPDAVLSPEAADAEGDAPAEGDTAAEGDDSPEGERKRRRRGGRRGRRSGGGSDSAPPA